MKSVELMEAQGKLTRTRSSIHSLSSVSELEVAGDGDEEEKKPHRPAASSAAAVNGGFPAVRMSRLVSVSVFAFFAVLSSVVYLRSEVEVSASENLLLGLTVVAVALFCAGRNRQLIDRSIFVFKQIYSQNSKKLRLLNNRTRSSVEWQIGCEKIGKPNGSSRRSSISTPEKEGVEIYTNGDIYEGEFHRGKCNGSGVYTYFVNGRYEGDWIDGKYDGYGIESWSKGSRYRGQYRQGLRHGIGVYRFFTGDTYAGEWFNGQYHGVGVQTCSDSSCYVGEFKCGVKHGHGCYHFRNGDRFAGEYFGDRIHGFGVYHFANGHRYEGCWHEGRKQGYGLYSFRNGEAKSGEWHLGILKSPVPADSDPVLRSVQSARKAAEKAINLRQVDHQVKKAVMAANRAATAARVAAIKAVQNRCSATDA